MNDFLFLAATDIFTNIEQIVKDYLQIGLEYAKSFVIQMPWYVSALIALAIVILLLIGIVRLIAKTWKVLLVLAVLGVIGYVVYAFVLNKGGDATTPTETIVFGSSLLRSIL